MCHIELGFDWRSVFRVDLELGELTDEDGLLSYKLTSTILGLGELKLQEES